MPNLAESRTFLRKRGSRVLKLSGQSASATRYFVETGHDFPARVPADQRRRLGEVAVAALRALGLGWGPAHTELRWTSAGIRIVEVNPRLAGGMIPRIVELACGVDLIRHTVARAAGLTAELGQQLTVRNSFHDRFGYLVSTGEDGWAAAERAERALALIEARIVPTSLTGRGV
ncbi:MAG: ATP-grasp domain-containing protein [Jatrophihabitantaceae bacterium]